MICNFIQMMFVRSFTEVPYYVSLSNEGRHIVLVWFFLPLLLLLQLPLPLLLLPLLLLLLSEACPDHNFLAHLTQRVMWAIVTTERPSSVVRRPSVNFSHFNQLLWSHWANLNQTLVEWSLDGPLPKLCPVIPTSNQDGHQAKNRKKGGWNFDCSLLL